MDSSIPPSLRLLRTYARREDAEQARAALSDLGIDAGVEEHFLKAAPGKPPVSAGCSLKVPAHQAADGARLLLRMPPSETAGRAEPAPPPMSRSPLRRRIGGRKRQKSSIPIIVIAVGCSAFGLFWIVRQVLRGPAEPVAVTGLPPEHVFVQEDVNWDGEVDSIREYLPSGQILSMQEDRDQDGKMDHRWIWQNAQLIYRDRDLDRDGIMDERTTFDAYNEPFYVDLRERGRGPVILRRVFREGVLWKILEDLDADTHFDRLQEFDAEGKVTRTELLEKGSPENGVPQPMALPGKLLRQEGLPLHFPPEPTK